MPLSIERAIELLELAEQGLPLPDDYRDKRYVVLHGLDPEVMRDPPEEDDPWLEKTKDWIGFRVAGEAKDLDSAFHLLWGSIDALHSLFGKADADAALSWRQKLSKWLAEGPWGVPDDEADCATNFGVGSAKSMWPKSRYELAVFGDAPYEGENACILELPPSVAPSGADAELLAACRDGDLDRAARLLSNGANPRVVDEFGDTPLHHAVALRSRPLALLLVSAGADLDAQARFCHAPVFAKRDAEGHVLPATSSFDDAAHFELVRFLVERGANPRAEGPFGDTLADVAASTTPMNEPWVRFFLDKGASSKLLRRSGENHRPLDNLLSALHFDTPEARKKIPDWIRLLGWLGCDPNSREHHWGKRTTLEDFLSTGYGDDEVEPEVMVAIAEALVEIGARDEIGEWDKRPSERADNWAKNHEKMGHYAKVAEVLRRGRRAEA